MIAYCAQTFPEVLVRCFLQRHRLWQLWYYDRSSGLWLLRTPPSAVVCLCPHLLPPFPLRFAIELIFFFVLKIHVEILSPNRMILGSFLREKIGHQHQTQLNTITTIVKTHVWLRSFCLCPARWGYNVKSHLWIRNWPLLEPDMLVLWPQPSRLKTSEKWVLLFICLLKNFLNLIF